MIIELTRRDEFAVITINRPDQLNALSFPLVKELGRLLDEVEESDARALLFIGTGTKSFSAGADINELLGKTASEMRTNIGRGQTTFLRLDNLKIPSIAVINGYAFGGGMELACSCTFRLCTPNAKVGLPEIKLGAIPGYGGTQRLPRLIGQTRALEIIMTGRTVEAQEALDIGLVSRIVEGQDPIAGAMEFARTFTKYSLPILYYTRRAVQRAFDQPVSEGIHMEMDLNMQAFASADNAEGVAAFLGKRKPEFKDA